MVYQNLDLSGIANWFCQKRYTYKSPEYKSRGILSAMFSCTMEISQTLIHVLFQPSGGLINHLIGNLMQTQTQILVGVLWLPSSWGSVYSNIPHSRKNHVKLTRTCHSDVSGSDAKSESSVASYSETDSVQSGHPSSYSPGHQNDSPDYIISLRNMNEARVKYQRSLLIEQTPPVSLLYRQVCRSCALSKI